MPRASTLQVLGDLAEEQWGLFTKRQAESTGMAWTTLARLARQGGAERVAPGVYRLRGSPSDQHLALRAAWLQLAPDTPAWERQPEQGTVSHRSAAALFGLGHLPADEHYFTLPTRRQTRRADVHLRLARLRADDWTRRAGILVTRPARTIADLLADLEDPGAVARVAADALRSSADMPDAVARALARHASRFGLRRADAIGALAWLLDLADAPERASWLDEARATLMPDN
ncbi:type IV toxin-antitoxin system AbiEi family antitoxin domain-containing protein [Actinomycetes bacterium KLBMP 9797]